MHNLYNITTNQAAIIELTRALRDLSSNLQPALNVFPDLEAAMVRVGPDGQRELVKASLGLTDGSLKTVACGTKEDGPPGRPGK